MGDYYYNPIDPYGPLKKKRKKRNEPRLDLSDPVVMEWLEIIVKIHPEIILPAKQKALIMAFSDTIGGVSKDINYLTDHLALEPGRPQVRPGKNFQMGEWDGWLAYYVLMQYAGFNITPQNIGDMTGHSAKTVNKAFKKVKAMIAAVKDKRNKPKD